MPETTIFIVAVIAAALAGYALGRSRGREASSSQGRLTLGTPPTGTMTTTQPAMTTTQLGQVPASMLEDVADGVESALDATGFSAEKLMTPGTHVSFKVDLKRTFKFGSKELADAVAERERAKGMKVVVTPPDATDALWRVDSTK